MRDELPYQLLANIVLAVHVGVVAFVLGGVLLVVVGNRRRWRWVNALWFRLLHLAAIVFVVAETWLQLRCPLTTLEMWLRERAGTHSYGGDFIEYWLQTLLYYDAPAWVFAVAYTGFAILVLALWWYYPPRTRLRREQSR